MGRRMVIVGGVLAVAGTIGFSVGSHAQNPVCTKVIDCANMMVQIANGLKVQNAALSAELRKVAGQLADQKTMVTALRSKVADELARIDKIYSEWGGTGNDLVVAPVYTDRAPYPQVADQTCQPGYYVTGGVNVSGTLTLQCRQVGIINK